MQKIVLGLLLVVCFSLATYGQSCVNANLELAGVTGTFPAGSGPDTSSQTFTFSNNVNNPADNVMSTYLPTTTVKFTLSNQQFTNMAGLAVPKTGMSFGRTFNAGSAKTTGQSAVSAFTGYTSNNYGTGGLSATTAVNATSNVGTWISINDGNGLAGTNQRPYYGDLTITFNNPVDYPVLHFNDFGAVTAGKQSVAEYEMTSGYSMTKLSGGATILISGDTIKGTPQSLQSGSIRINGTGITSITFKVYLKSNSTANWGISTGGEAMVIGVSIPSTVPNQPSLSKTVITNVCPATSVNLNTALPAAIVGQSYEWHSVATGATAGNLINNPTTYSGASPVYLFAKDSLTGCYSALGDTLKVNFVNCTYTISCSGTTVFREDFGSADDNLPFGVSGAEHPYDSTFCINGFVTDNTAGYIGTGTNFTNDVAGDGDTGTHFLAHFSGVGGALCSNAVGSASWLSTANISVVAGQVYEFSYYYRKQNTTGSNTVLQQQVVPTSGTITTISTTNNAIVNASWVKNTMRFTASASGPVVLRLNNMLGPVGGNDFALDNIALKAIILDTPMLAVTSAYNNCPDTTANLTNFNPTTPAGLTYEWHTVATNPSAATLVANPTSVGAGTYYIYVKSGTNCLSALSDTLTVTIYNPCLDCDNDGVPNQVDIDDDNDGVTDAVENVCTYGTTTFVHPADLTWDKNGIAFPGTLQSNRLPNVNSASTTISFGPGFTTAVAFSNAWQMTGANATTFAQAKALNEYIQFTIPTTAYPTNYILTEWLTVGIGGAYQNLGIEISTDPTFATSTKLYEGVNGNPGGVFENNPIALQTEYKMISGNTYYVRAYPYGTLTSILFDAFAFNTKCEVDTDGDGIPNTCDADSDGDGCSDAYEGGATTVKTQTTIAGPFGLNGLANSMENNDSQTATTSYSSTYSTYGTNATSNKCNLADCDNDGVVNAFDIDDDNDGVLDATEEFACGSTNANAQTATGSGIFKNNLYWPQWTAAAFVDGVQNGDSQTFTLADGTIITATFSNVFSGTGNTNTSGTAPNFKPADMGGFSGAQAKNLYNPIGTQDAFYTGGTYATNTDNQDVKFDITFTATKAGNPVPLNIVFADAEASQVAVAPTEYITSTTDGSPWQVLESIGTSTIAGIGTQKDSITVTTAGTKLLVTQNASNISVNINAGGKQAVAFGFLFYCDKDNDGIANTCDTDDDGDGCSTAVEAGLASIGQTTVPGPYGLNGLANSIESSDSMNATVVNAATSVSNYQTYASNNALNACSTDCDADGIPNAFDTDDDNDGISDIAEGCPADVCNIAGNLINNPYFSNGTLGAGQAPVGYTFGPTYTNVSYLLGRTNAGRCVATNTNVLYVDIRTGTDYFWRQNVSVTPNSPYTFALAVAEETAFNGSVTVEVYDGTSVIYTDTIRSTATSGTFTNFSFNFTSSSSSNLRISLIGNITALLNNDILIDDIALTTTPCLIDTDNDGIPNSCDLDSDNDGCTDAIESGNALTTNATYASTTVYPAVPPSVTTSTSYNQYAKDSTINACSDCDNDGVPNVLDIDDDNDGVLDAVECAASQPYKVYMFSRNSTTPNVSTNIPVAIVGKTTQNVLTDQVNAGTDLSMYGYNWKLLASNVESNASNQITVSMLPTATTTGTFILADAMLITNGINTYVIDNSNAGFSQTGFPAQNIPGAYIGNENFSTSPHTGHTATWAFTNILNASACDKDNDGITNACDLDSDGDACPDAYEGGATTSQTQTTFAGPYGSNGLANSIETNDSINAKTTFANTFTTFGLDSTLSKCKVDTTCGAPSNNVVNGDMNGTNLTGAMTGWTTNNATNNSLGGWIVNTAGTNQYGYNDHDAARIDSLAQTIKICELPTNDLVVDFVYSLREGNNHTTFKVYWNGVPYYVDTTADGGTFVHTISYANGATGNIAAGSYSSSTSPIPWQVPGVGWGHVTLTIPVPQNAGQGLTGRLSFVHQVFGGPSDDVFMDSVVVKGSNCINAGNDTSVCQNGTAALKGKSYYPGTTTWTAVPGNPGTATIATPSAYSTNVSGFTSSGTYKFALGNGTCSDTVSLTVTVCVPPLTGCTGENLISSEMKNIPANSATYTFLGATYGNTNDVTITKTAGTGPNMGSIASGTLQGIHLGAGIPNNTYEDYELVYSTLVAGSSLTFRAINNNVDGREELQNFRIYDAAGIDITSSATFYFQDKSFAPHPTGSPNGPDVVFDAATKTIKGVQGTNCSTQIPGGDTGAGGSCCDDGGMLTIQSTVPFKKITFRREGRGSVIPSCSGLNNSNGVTLSDSITFCTVAVIATPDTVTKKPTCPTCPVNACVIADDITGGVTGATFSTCPPPPGYTVVGPDANGCVTYTGPSTPATTPVTTCIVACKNGVCDTTYVIINPPVTPDTVTKTPTCPTCPINVCVVADDIIGGASGSTFTTCPLPPGYTKVGPDANGCVTYTGPSTPATTPVTTCIVACKNGVCDTTYVIINPPVTPDTVTKTPTCPTCPVNVCVVADDIVGGASGSTFTTCPLPLGYTKVGPDANGCITYTGPSTPGTVPVTTCIVACKNGVCDTTYIIINPPVSPDTVTKTPTCPTCPINVCVVADDIVGGASGSTFTTCPTPAGFTKVGPDANGCVIYTGPSTPGTSPVTTCIVACKNGVCDTTYVIINPPVTPDTNKITPACPTCPVNTCVVADDLTPGGQTYTSCGTPNGYTAVGPNASGCMTYTPNGPNTTPDTTCIVACKNGVCDTTYIIIAPPVKPDTVIKTPACPTCPVTVCQVINDVTITAGATFSSCPTPAGYTATPTDVNGCKTYTPSGTNITPDTTCQVICKNGVCDTTYVIINPPVTPDTNTVTPSCPICPINTCVVADDLTPGGQTYSACSTPAGYTQAGPDVNGCITITPLPGATGGTTCIVACKNGVCDTTYIIINPPVSPDTVIVKPSCPTCPVTACVVADEIVGGATGATFTTCPTPAGFTKVGPDANGCITYTGPSTPGTSPVTTCVVACKNGICDTTYIIIEPPVTPDSVTVTPSCPTCPVTICQVLDDIPNASGATFSSCPPPAGYTLGPINALGCRTYTPNGTVTTAVSTCQVICKNGVCDTTFIIINPPITPDTVKATPACPTCPVTVCQTLDDVTSTTGATFNSCPTPAGYTAGPIDANGCRTFTPNGTVTTTVTTCQVICNNGKCDTTYIIIDKPITPDTNKVTPACPTCPVNTCVQADDLTPGAQTYTTCGTPSGYTAVGPDVNGCMTYTPNGPNTSPDTTCIVACKNGKCDTTYIIINPPVTPDSVTVQPTCPTCPVKACVIGDDLPTLTGATFTSCGLSATDATKGSLVLDLQGCLIWVGNGTQGPTDTIKSCVVACKNGVCDTTYVTILPAVPPYGPDSIYTTPTCGTCPTPSVCVTGDDIPVAATNKTYTSCGLSSSDATKGSLNFNSTTGCVVWTPNGTQTDTVKTCVIVCGQVTVSTVTATVCDTTYMFFPPPPKPDTITKTPACPTCPVTACPTADNITITSGTTFSTCATPAGYTASGPDAAGCMTYTPTTPNTSPLTTCVVACNGAICDTTYVIINPPITPDTNTVRPACPTCPVTTCVQADDLTPGGLTYSSCGAPSNYTQSAPDVNGCITLTPQNVTTGGTTCIVACKNGQCDTTYIIILPPITPDTNYVTPICSTCPVTTCVQADDLTPGGQTYTSCASAPGYTQTAPDANGCITITANTGTSSGGTTCVVACKNGVCDTTYIIIHLPDLNKLNPDFNSTFVNVPVSGNIKTNDVILDPGTTYGTPTPIPGNPGACVPVMSATGTYTFTCSTPGEYNYWVPVCPTGVTVNCPQELLTITVLDPNTPLNPPTADPDYGTTKQDTPITIDVKANDKCNNSPTCSLTNPTIVDSANHGSVIVNPDGTIKYTPNPGFTGKDTLQYKVCDNQTPVAKCDTEYVFIDVLPASAPNSTTAMDDYKKGGMGEAVTGNVKTNDTDPEANNQTVTPQNTVIPGKGTFVLNPDGTYTFSPVDTFKGPIDIPYTTCDDGTPQACSNATLHILIAQPDVSPNISATPNIMHGTTSFNVTVKVTELNMVKTNGLITVRIPKDYRLSFTYNPSAIKIGFTNVSNSLWTYNSANPFFHIFTTTTVIPKGGFSTFGFVASFAPGSTNGKYTMSSTISSGSGSENRINNNVDSESLDYFHN